MSDRSTLIQRLTAVVCEAFESGLVIGEDRVSGAWGGMTDEAKEASLIRPTEWLDAYADEQRALDRGAADTRERHWSAWEAKVRAVLEGQRETGGDR